MSQNKTQTSLWVPPNSSDVSFCSNSSTIFSETYFLKVDLTLLIPERSSKDKTTPDLSFSSLYTGDRVKFISLNCPSSY